MRAGRCSSSCGVSSVQFCMFDSLSYRKFLSVQNFIYTELHHDFILFIQTPITTSLVKETSVKVSTKCLQLQTISHHCLSYKFWIYEGFIVVKVSESRKDIFTCMTSQCKVYGEIGRGQQGETLMSTWELENFFGLCDRWASDANWMFPQNQNTTERTDNF